MKIAARGWGVERLGAIEAAMGLVASRPLRGPTWDRDPRYRRVLLRGSPYLLFDERRADSIEFVAVVRRRLIAGVSAATLARQSGLFAHTFHLRTAASPSPSAPSLPPDGPHG
jgi:hypothetical protein